MRLPIGWNAKPGKRQAGYPLPILCAGFPARTGVATADANESGNLLDSLSFRLGRRCAMRICAWVDKKRAGARLPFGNGTPADLGLRVGERASRLFPWKGNLALSIYQLVRPMSHLLVESAKSIVRHKTNYCAPMTIR
jgi:hypothetical protein